MARLILTEAGEDVDVGGNVTVIGTRSGGEVITVFRGTIVLDASFNAGGDTIVLPGDSFDFTVRMSGALAIFEAAGVRVSVPVGAAGIAIAFADVSRPLAIDPALGLVRLGTQTLTATAQQVEAAGAAPTILGTEGADTLTGTAGNDVIHGLGGADLIDGGAGDDILRGGLGDDRLLGSTGVDELYGGEGADRIIDEAGAHSFADGGGGNDWITLGNPLGSVQVIGGYGDDLIEVQGSAQGRSWIDAGEGADRVRITLPNLAVFDLYLGAGTDELTPIRPLSSAPGSSGLLIVYDFAPGASGDKVDLSRLLGDFATGFSQGSDPFRSGHFRLVERGGDTFLQIDRDGAASSGHGFLDLVQFVGRPRTAFTSSNFGGFDPLAPAAAYDTDLALSDEALRMPLAGPSYHVL